MQAAGRRVKRFNHANPARLFLYLRARAQLNMPKLRSRPQARASVRVCHRDRRSRMSKWQTNARARFCVCEATTQYEPFFSLMHRLCKKKLN